MRVTHDNGTTDRRYKVGPQAIGKDKPQYVATFCGQYLAHAATDWQAWLICAENKAARIGGEPGNYLNKQPRA